MLAIIQGLYILREDEDEEFERRRKEAAQRIRAREEAQSEKYLKKDVPETENIHLYPGFLWLFLWQ